MNQEELQVAAFEIILHSGTARTEIHEAFADMREGDVYKRQEQGCCGCWYQGCFGAQYGYPPAHAL